MLRAPSCSGSRPSNKVPVANISLPKRSPKPIPHKNMVEAIWAICTAAHVWLQHIEVTFPYPQDLGLSMHQKRCSLVVEPAALHQTQANFAQATSNHHQDNEEPLNFQKHSLHHFRHLANASSVERLSLLLPSCLLCSAKQGVKTLCRSTYIAELPWPRCVLTPHVGL